MAVVDDNQLDYNRTMKTYLRLLCGHPNDDSVDGSGR